MCCHFFEFGQHTDGVFVSIHKDHNYRQLASSVNQMASRPTSRTSAPFIENPRADRTVGGPGPTSAPSPLMVNERLDFLQSGDQFLGQVLIGLRPEEPRGRADVLLHPIDEVHERLHIGAYP